MEDTQPIETPVALEEKTDSNNIEEESKSLTSEEATELPKPKKKRVLSDKQKENLKKGRERLKEVMEQRKKLRIEEKVSAYLDTFMKSRPTEPALTSSVSLPTPTEQAEQLKGNTTEEDSEDQYSSSDEEFQTTENSVDLRNYQPPYITRPRATTKSLPDPPRITRGHTVVFPERTVHLGFV